MERYGNKLKGFLCDSLQEVGVELQSIDKDIELYNNEIKEIEKRQSALEENIDFSFEIFSPIKHKNSFEQDEINNFKKQISQKKFLISNLEKEKAKLLKKQTTLKGALYQLDPNNELEARDFEELYGAKILEQQEADRQRIARELHDTTVQNLTGMIHKMEFCKAILDKDKERVKNEIDFMSSVLKESIDGMRDIIYDLRPMTFDDIGFVETLNTSISKIQRNTDTVISYEVKGNVIRVAPVIEITLLRLMQEACNNAKKHAEAKTVNVILEYRDKKICLEVKDDGKGFDISEAKSKGRFGLSIMAERVYLLKGDIDIQSEIGKGTRVYVEIPVMEKTVEVTEK